MYNDFEDIFDAPQEPTGGEEPVQETEEVSEPQEASTEPSYTEPPVYGVSYAPEPKKKPKKGWTLGKVIALVLCCSLLSGLVGAGGVLLGTMGWRQQQAAGETSQGYEGKRPNTVLDIASIDTNKIMTPAEVYAVNVGSTVGITVGITTNFWGYQTTTPASGSGFILTEDGYILTNFHVIEGGSTITVSLYDGTSYNAEVIGYDESNDIAVLKVDATGLTPVVLGDSGNMNVGDTVCAIGNPLGELTFSFTLGTVSALNREVTMSTGLTMDLIQTDCAINSGNSGGALFNLYGEVVGITNAKYSSSGSGSQASIDNIGFAIPINQVRSIVESIIEKGYIAKPFIGVSVEDVSEQMQSYGLPKGAAIVSVTEGSPAQEGGLLVSDIVTHVNGQAITGSQDLVDVVGACEKGDRLAFTVYRQGRTVELNIAVGEQIQSAMGQQSSQNQQGQQGQGGFSFPWGFGGFGW